MRVINSVKLMRAAVSQIKSRNKKIGFVPTMGALHEGHCSLIRQSRRENEATIVSIFVNPRQFGPKEDFLAYPRPEKKDILLAKNEKVDIIFRPSEKVMYPVGYLTSVLVEKLSDALCGQMRPGHFQGVATIVAKLLNIVTPNRLYLGQKDAQQAIVLKRMISDLNMPVAVKVCPIVRERDGLALSSRNVHLTDQQRRDAPILFQSLLTAKKKILSGERNAAKIIRCVRETIQKQRAAEIEYIACVNAETLSPLPLLHGKIMVALAVKFGKTRLIDNMVTTVK